jgi:hypothetical protein
MCPACGDVAGQLVLQFFHLYGDVTLVIDGVVGQTTTWLSQEQARWLEEILKSGQARPLFDWNDEWASFYCAECARVYCRKHWETEVVFDDDPAMPGWYDCTYGTCPKGHRRIVDD